MPSTVIRRINYQPERNHLVVTFTSGDRYVYHEVPPEAHEAFVSTPSKGSFFTREVRDRYRFRRLATLAAVAPASGALGLHQHLRPD